MPFTHTIRGERFTFPDLRDLLAKANEAKSGDALAGIAAGSERERVAAKLALADVPLSVIAETPVVDPDTDDVTRLVLDSHDRTSFGRIRSMTVGEFREFLLEDTTTGETLGAL
jgi:ethanolamine ammonia-lyase large subunit